MAAFLILVLPHGVLSKNEAFPNFSQENITIPKLPSTAATRAAPGV